MYKITYRLLPIRVGYLRDDGATCIQYSVILLLHMWCDFV